MLRALERILTAHHDVVIAPSAAEALARIAGATAIDGVLCDVMMPGMNGMELYQEIGRRAPELAARVVFVTGGALLEEVRVFLEETGAPVVEKPFAPAQILEVVAGLVEGRAPISRPTPPA